MFLPLKILGFYSAHEPYLKPSAWYTIHIKKITTHTRWAQKTVINEVSYNPYKWPHKLVTGVVTLFIGVINPFITGSGAHLVFFALENWYLGPVLLGFGLFSRCYAAFHICWYSLLDLIEETTNKTHNKKNVIEHVSHRIHLGNVL